MIAPGNRAAAAFAVVLLVAAAIAALALRPPPAAPTSAPASDFSAARALVDVRAIAQQPHPMGSAEASRVRGYLAGRLRSIGLRAQLRPTASGPDNIIAVLPGTDPAAPAVMLMSHSDSVPKAPGAADDAAGVAASLEVARALKAAGPHRRDLMLLITDGEEAGLKGAKAFFSSDPLAERAGVILNLEARGAGGRAVMFETHEGAAPLIATLRRSGALRGASSLMPDLYRRLPNDTDLTEALKTGRQGLNFAFFGDQAAYHQPTDTPDRLDPGSLQSIGDQALAAARVLVDAPALPPRATDTVYADILGGPVIQYPTTIRWLLVFAAGLMSLAALVLARRAGRVSLSAVAWGAGQGLATVAICAGGLMALSTPFAGFWRPLLNHFQAAFAGYALFAAGGAFLAAWLIARGPWHEGKMWGAWLGTLLLWTVIAFALQAIAPLDAFVLAWPTAAGAACALLAVTGQRWARLTALALATVTLAQVFYWAGLTFTLVGIQLPFVLGGFVALASPVALPLAVVAMAGRQRWIVPAIALISGLIITAAAALIG